MPRLGERQKTSNQGVPVIKVRSPESLSAAASAPRGRRERVCKPIAIDQASSCRSGDGHGRPRGVPLATCPRDWFVLGLEGGQHAVGVVLHDVLGDRASVGAAFWTSFHVLMFLSWILRGAPNNANQAKVCLTAAAVFAAGHDVATCNFGDGRELSRHGRNCTRSEAGRKRSERTSA